MDYLEFIARVISHIPDKEQVMVRYYCLSLIPTDQGVSGRKSRKIVRYSWLAQKGISYKSAQ